MAVVSGSEESGPGGYFDQPDHERHSYGRRRTDFSGLRGQSRASLTAGARQRRIQDRSLHDKLPMLGPVAQLVDRSISSGT